MFKGQKSPSSRRGGARSAPAQNNGRVQAHQPKKKKKHKFALPTANPKGHNINISSKPQKKPYQQIFDKDYKSIYDNHDLASLFPRTPPPPPKPPPKKRPKTPPPPPKGFKPYRLKDFKNLVLDVKLGGRLAVNKNSEEYQRKRALREKMLKLAQDIRRQHAEELQPASVISPVSPSSCNSRGRPSVYSPGRSPGRAGPSNWGKLQVNIPVRQQLGQIA